MKWGYRLLSEECSRLEFKEYSSLIPPLKSHQNPISRCLSTRTLRLHRDGNLHIEIAYGKPIWSQ